MYIHAHIGLFAVLIGLAALAAAWFVLRQSAFYRRLMEREESSRRHHAIDGLRGFLALSVVVHHIAMNFNYYLGGSWGSSGSRLGMFMGHGAVAAFFMITSLLFWGGAMAEDGRLDGYRFYISRIRRIVPMYMVAAGLTIVTALALTGFTLQVPPEQLARQVLAWLLFTIPGSPPINNYSSTAVINTVFWSLVYEWAFYITLPFFSVFASARHRWYLAAVFSGFLLLFPEQLKFGWFFLAGGVVAALVQRESVRKIAIGWPASAIAIACIVAEVAYVRNFHGVLGATAMFIPFLAIAAGNSMFGLLTCRPARLLGAISYSVYLMHNWVLFVLSRALDQLVPVKSLSAWQYGAFGIGVALAAIALSCLTFRYVERPYLRSARKETQPASPAVVR